MRQQYAARFGNSQNRPNLLIIIEPVRSESCDEYIIAHFEASSLLLNPFGQDRQQSQLTITEYGGNTEQTMRIKKYFKQDEDIRLKDIQHSQRKNYRMFGLVCIRALKLIAQLRVQFVPRLRFIANLKYDQIKLTSAFETIQRRTSTATLREELP